MPEDLKERLKAFVPQPAQAKINSVDEIPAVIQQRWERFNWETDKQESGIEDIPLEQRQMERAAQNELIAVLRLINVGKVSVSDKTRYPTAATQKEIASLLSGGDYYTDPPPEERKPYEQLIGSIRAYAFWEYSMSPISTPTVLVMIMGTSGERTTWINQVPQCFAEARLHLTEVGIARSSLN